jgi:RNA polymerase sigma-70 factor, ECF subfamily
MSLCNSHDQCRDSESVFDPELLLVLAKGGDGQALGRLLERYRNYVGLLVRLQVGRRLRTKVDIEDLLQEIWLEIHRKIALFRGGSEREFLSWARRLIGSILANQVRHYIGTKSRDVRLERALADELDQSS